MNKYNRLSRILSSFIFYFVVYLCVLAAFFCMLSGYTLPLFLYAARHLVSERRTRWWNGKKMFVVVLNENEAEVLYKLYCKRLSPVVQTYSYVQLHVSNPRCKSNRNFEVLLYVLKCAVLVQLFLMLLEQAVSLLYCLVSLSCELPVYFSNMLMFYFLLSVWRCRSEPCHPICSICCCGNSRSEVHNC